MYSVNEGDGIVQNVLVLNSTPAVDITVHVVSNNGSAVHDTSASPVQDTGGSAFADYIQADYEYVMSYFRVEPPALH